MSIRNIIGFICLSRIYSLQKASFEFQRETRDRLHLPFQLLSDNEFHLKDALNLPTFTVSGMQLNKRLTMIIDQGHISKIFYPVYPPDLNADEVFAWLKTKAL